MKSRTLASMAVSALLLLPQGIAMAGDLGVVGSSVRFQPETALEGRKIHMYATVHNFSKEDLKGVVRFFDGKPPGVTQIQGDQAVSVVANGDDIVFVDALLSPGNHEIYLQVFPFDAAGNNPANDVVSKSITVLKDTDRDGITDAKDPDDDNDGVPDAQDFFPLNAKESRDTDGDGIGDNADPDDDNDGIPDKDDAFPRNADEVKDTDGDGIGDNADPDIDGDSISNEDEKNMGLDPLKKDTDGDSVDDSKDAFPKDPLESSDYDHDGIGDHADNDADNDGTPKGEDINDTNLPPKIVVQSLPFFLTPGKDFFINLNKSMDPDGVISDMTLTVSGGAKNFSQKVSPGSPVSLHFEEPGTYTLAFAATDDKGEKTEKSMKVRVHNPSFYTAISIAAISFLTLAILATVYYSNRARRKLRRKKRAK